MKHAATIFLSAFIVSGMVVRYPAPLCGGKTAYYFPVAGHYQISCEHGATFF